MERKKLMYEKLDKIRGDLEKARQRRAEADAKVKALEEKLQEAENTQVLADVSALKLTPEQVAQFLKLAASGQLPMNSGSAAQAFTTPLPAETKYSTEESKNENDNFDEEDMEDYEDEK